MKEGSDKVDLLHASIYQTLLQVDTINLGEYGQSCPKYQKAINTKVFYQMILSGLMDIHGQTYLKYSK